MKKKLISVSIIAFIFLLCLFPSQLSASSSKSLILWYSKILPSLFPFAIAINMLESLGVAKMLNRKLSPITKILFHLNGHTAFPIVFGALAGFPTSANILNDLYKKNIISLKECQCLMSFSNNPGLIFIISTVGVIFLNNKIYGYIILGGTLLSSLITGIICGKVFNPSNNNYITKFVQKTEPIISIGKILSSSITLASQILIMIGGCIMLFGIIIELLYIANVLSSDNLIFSGIVSGLFEMTTGLELLGKSTLPIEIKIGLCTFIVNFGGLSVLMQVFGCSSAIPINRLIFIFNHFLKAVLAATISVCIYLLII